MMRENTEEKKNLALMLFREGRLSFGKATELAGVSRWEFMELARKEKIPLGEPTSEELEEEFRLSQKIAKESRAFFILQVDADDK
jgi:predicted HTH domain antitoxin